MAELVYAIDVSNWQGPDIVPIIQQHKPQHVTVRLSTESSRHRELAMTQMIQTLQQGCTLDGYIWAYWNVDARDHIKDCLFLAERGGITKDAIIWIDCEDENGAHPGSTIGWLASAVEAIEQAGYRAGIYTGQPFWVHHVGNDPNFARLPLWVANYDGLAELRVVNPRLFPFGGWTQLAGKQWSGSPIDRSVFDAAQLYVQAAPVEPAPPAPIVVSPGAFAELAARVAGLEDRLRLAGEALL